MEVQHLRKLFDRYGDGTMDYQDFCFRVCFSNKATEVLSKKLSARFLELRRNGTDVRSVFGMFDIGKTGFISRKNFREVLRKLNVPVTDHQVQCMQDKFRQLGDVNAVSYEDFLTFVVSSNPPLCRTTTDAATQRSPGPSTINPWGGANFKSRMKFQHETLDNYMPESSAARKMKSPSHQLKVYHDVPVGQAKKNFRAVNDEWTCPVCFYSSNSPKSRGCEICAAPNSGRRRSQKQQQCSNCTFANDELEVECGVCGESLLTLHGHSKQRSRQQQRTRNIGKHHKKTTHHGRGCYDKSYSESCWSDVSSNDGK